MSKSINDKMIELEAVRGLAAIVVFFHHFLLYYAPKIHGRPFPDEPTAMVRTPLFTLINGSAAVAVFFVLSGFVLTYKSMQTGTWHRLVNGAVKRWPRLAAPVLVANIPSAILLGLGLYQHTNEVWFDPDYYGSFAVVMKKAVIEGGITTFIPGSSAFNACLWTMHYEFIGSFCSYAVAFLMMLTRSHLLAQLCGLASIIGLVAFSGESGELFAILIAGVMIARLYVHNSAFSLSGWQIALMLAVIFMLCGYEGHSKPVGFYEFLEPYASDSLRRLFHGIGAVLTILLVLYHQPLRRLLSGNIGAWLGKMSFPIYLVHLPVMLGLIYPINLYFAANVDEALVLPLSFLCAVALSLIAAYPLMYFDAWWVAKLNSLHIRSGLSVPHSNYFPLKLQGARAE